MCHGSQFGLRFAWFVAPALLCSWFASATVFAQEPEDYVEEPGTRTYTILGHRNPLFRRGVEIDVTTIRGEAYVEGDIEVGSVAELDRMQNFEFSVTQDDNAVVNARWESGIVPFEIEDGFTDEGRQRIISAMNHYSASTNVCFVPRTNQANWVRFKKYTTEQLGFSGGSSWLGRCGGCVVGQEIKLTSTSDRLVRHEIGHALGLSHEQSREDRDEHVEILWENIRSGREGNFQQNILFTTDIGSYDFSSIMHYRPHAFGRKERGVEQQTIVNLHDPDDLSFGAADVLSAGDVAGVNSMYPTNQACAVLSARARGELDVGQSVSVDVRANRSHNLTGIFMRQGQRFEFTTANRSWKNGSHSTDCDGYAPSILDTTRRHLDIDMMTLTGEIFEQNNTSSYTGKYVNLGCGRSWTATATGFLVTFANDTLLNGYADNSERVVLTVRRTR